MGFYDADGQWVPGCWVSLLSGRADDPERGASFSIVQFWRLGFVKKEVTEGRRKWAEFPEPAQGGDPDADTATV